jgi:flagellar M-ring protein FliF
MPARFLASLSQRARLGLGVGTAAIAIALAVAGAWLLRTEDQVLFADLQPQDAATLAAELDRQKIAYRIGDDGRTLLVDGAIVHATRLKLMGRDLPLHGATGFELFNAGDFGMTEFAQKVNYQRALQGEITRTILSLAEVREARVHLALPEEGLFKRAENKPKAAITLGMREGRSLRPDQVSGIQRLVAGSVPGIAAQDVTIVDDRGVALTRNVAGEASAEVASGSLDLKRETEQLLARKATQVLERAFGAGQALAAVDATLNMDQVRITTEDVVAPPASAGQAQTGVIVREREVARDVPTPIATAADAPARSGSSQRDVDYQVGRRVEQVVSQPGAVRRLHVAAVIRAPLDAQQLDQARALIAAAVGASPERGDSVVVQSLAAFAAQPAPAPSAPMREPTASAVPMREPTASAVPAPVRQGVGGPRVAAGSIN